MLLIGIDRTISESTVRLAINQREVRSSEEVAEYLCSTVSLRNATNEGITYGTVEVHKVLIGGKAEHQSGRNLKEYVEDEDRRVVLSPDVLILLVQ